MAIGQIQAIILEVFFIIQKQIVKIKSFLKGKIEMVKKLVYGKLLRMEIMKNLNQLEGGFIMNKVGKIENGKIWTKILISYQINLYQFQKQQGVL
ncbi:unnamed protein product [Paramecium sonneborni]|uniref:Uncharacterized protein n=1 Tax=Paramecium sonneborni TaxID=65129 RepID=A0A8S1PTR5_9CILI|nr:unnamed protein product [Paramecium sonneborni]